VGSRTVRFVATSALNARRQKVDRQNRQGAQQRREQERGPQHRELGSAYSEQPGDGASAEDANRAAKIGRSKHGAVRRALAAGRDVIGGDSQYRHAQELGRNRQPDLV
jgi:hypothetical protein